MSNLFTELGRLLKKRRLLQDQLREIENRLDQILRELRDQYDLHIQAQGSDIHHESPAYEVVPEFQVSPQPISSDPKTVEQIRSEAFSGADAPPLDVSQSLKVLEKYLRKAPIVPAQPRKND